VPSVLTSGVLSEEGGASSAALVRASYRLASNIEHACTGVAKDQG